MAADVRPDEREAAKLSGEGASDTIFALSSGSPPAAIALVRVSGPKADEALLALAGRLPEPRTASLAALHHQGELLDHALLLRFPGPHSVTGEDVAELHLHGGRSVVAGVLAALATLDGLRPALPGEFTRRAFESGRIDLVEAEGLADLLEAETESQRRNALALAGGALSRHIGDWQARILALAALVEAALDFSDEDDVGPLPADFTEGLASLRQELADWLDRPSAERLKDGIRVVIAGPPNAGKSSLLNCLAGRDAAIISAIPGTTRDIIEASVAFGGVPFLLADTAGLREPGEEIEAIGVERARRTAETADIVLWLGQPGEAPPRSIRVHPKVDLAPAPADVDIAVSSLDGTGVAELVRRLIQDSTLLLPREGEVAVHARHRELLGMVCESLQEAATDLDPILVGEALRRARTGLDRLTGRAGVEDMLDSLFGRFCIGK